MSLDAKGAKAYIDQEKIENDTTEDGEVLDESKESKCLICSMNIILAKAQTKRQ